MSLSAQANAVIFGVIGAASLVTNFVFCLMLCRKRTLLKKPHNILLLTLSNIDMMTGAIIFVTPWFGIIEEPFLHGVFGYLFCYLLDNTFIVFMLGKASILIVMLSALERWFSLTKPFTYKLYFTRKKLLKYISFILVLTAVLASHKLFEAGFKDNKCVDIRGMFGEEGQQAFVLSYVIGTFYIPSLITWVSFIHTFYRAKTSPSLVGMSEQARAQQRLLLRMCAITAAVLTGCWLPSQTIYILNHFGFQLYREVKVTIIFSMFNSAVNPCIYFLSNKEYRTEFLSLFSLRKKNTQVSPETAMPENDTQVGQMNSA